MQPKGIQPPQRENQPFRAESNDLPPTSPLSPDEHVAALPPVRAQLPHAVQEQLVDRLRAPARKAAARIRCAFSVILAPDDILAEAFMTITRAPPPSLLEMSWDRCEGTLYNYCWNAGRNLAHRELRERRLRLRLQQRLLATQSPLFHDDSGRFFALHQDRDAFTAWFSEALRRCGTDQNRAILRLLLEDKSRSEIATELGKSEGAVSAAMLRIRAILQAFPPPVE